MTTALPRRATDDPEVSHVPNRAETYGTMGLTGLWALVGNSTGMAIVAVVLFMSLFQLTRMHNDAMRIFQEFTAQERDSNRQEREINRLNYEQMRVVIDKNTNAINALTSEIRKAK